MKRWLLIFTVIVVGILGAGILGAFWLSRSEAPMSSKLGPALASNALARARVSGGGHHALAIAPDGSLWSWGQAGPNLGRSNLSLVTSRPQRVGTNTDWAEITAGSAHSLAVKHDGSLWAWGFNVAGMLGDGTAQTRVMPARIGTNNGWLMAGAGLNHSAGLKRDGSIWTWGLNNYGQLGRPELANPTNQSFAPLRVGDGTNWKAVAVCAIHNVALKDDGTLWTWGDSALTPWATIGSPSNHLAPTQIGTDTNWAAVAAGYYHTLALKKDGTLWHWGRNSHLLGGIPSALGYDTVRPMQTDADWTEIYAGAYGNFARKKDGAVWELGGDHAKPGRLRELDGAWQSVAGGSEFGVGIATDGSVWSWGVIIGEPPRRNRFKSTLGSLLKAVGVANNFGQPVTPTRSVPEKIFQLPAAGK